MTADKAKTWASQKWDTHQKLFLGYFNFSYDKSPNIIIWINGLSINRIGIKIQKFKSVFTGFYNVWIINCRHFKYAIIFFPDFNVDGNNAFTLPDTGNSFRASGIRQDFLKGKLDFLIFNNSCLAVIQFKFLVQFYIDWIWIDLYFFYFNQYN